MPVFFEFFPATADEEVRSGRPKRDRKKISARRRAARRNRRT